MKFNKARVIPVHYNVCFSWDWFGLVWFVCLLIQDAIVQACTVVTPNSVSIVGYTGQAFNIQADVTGSSYTTYPVVPRGLRL